MGCLFSILKSKEQPTLTQRLASDLSGSEESEINQGDLDDFSQIKTRQIFVTDSLGENTKKVSVDDFTMLKVLGKGSFGKVVLVEKKDTSTSSDLNYIDLLENVYAMKILRKEAIIKRNQKIHTKAEREILENMSSPFIVQLHFAFQSPSKLYLIMDFMNGGELFFHLRREKKFSEARTKFYGAEIVLALEHLHTKGIIYRDLKPENILMDCDGHIKICDFGLSKQGIEGGKKAFTFCGTPEYLAPEILQGLGHDKAVDYWSLGALLYEMLAGMPPFYSKDRAQMFKNILERPVEMKSTFSPEACSLFSALLVVDPHKRMNNAFEIKRHEFFRGIDWEKLAKMQIKPPFKPNVTGIKDLRYFDKMFTDESLNETPLTKHFTTNTGNTFQGFTYDPNHPNASKPAQNESP